MAKNLIGMYKRLFFTKQVRLAMVPRNSQLILFETYIQLQQFLMTKKKSWHTNLQRVENRILQHLAKFGQNLMDRSQVIRLNPS